jgi:hypothetical protein
MMVAGTWIRGAVALAVSVLVLPGCGSEKSPSPAPAAAAGSETAVERLPAPVSETRSAILAAAESGDYEPLRAVVEPDVFLSDFGFGNEPDPVGRWQGIGPKPLQTMGVVLRMPHTVRETNEGTLYEWPRFDANSNGEDLSEAERDLLLTLMTEDELNNAFLPELGYTGPSLGILADGNWWFFILEGEGQ